MLPSHATSNNRSGQTNSDKEGKNIGHQGIGIHGTHDDNSIRTRATEGCIRLKNEDLEGNSEIIFLKPSKQQDEAHRKKSISQHP
jgi:hypothetical protein